MRLKNLLIGYVAANTDKEPEIIAKDMDRDFYLPAKEAVEYGIVDQVMQR